MTFQMNIPHPLVDDQTYLRHFWHPVCTLKELADSNPQGNGPIGRKLLGENIVIAKLNGKPVAMRDRCAHRFAKLSGGKIVDERLQCPYHGWQYGNDGKCVYIPACPRDPIPKKAHTETYECAVKYDIVWVRLDSSWDCTKIPYCSGWDNPEYKKVIVAAPYDWDSSSERRWENFTDFSHFAFVHPGTLYDPAFAEPSIVPIDRVGGEMRFYLEPGKASVEKFLGGWTYRAAMPFTINLEMLIASNNKPFLLWTTSSPVSANECRNFMIIAHTDPDLPDKDPLDFQKIVLAEDKPVIETQPGGLSLEEVALPTDKVSNQYRKWLRELGAAAQVGKAAFEKALLTDVIESR